MKMEKWFGLGLIASIWVPRLVASDFDATTQTVGQIAGWLVTPVNQVVTPLWLPNGHTSGTRFGSPTPEAQIADNDLAFGQIVDAVSHSPFWTNTCIFAVEDDPQDGWDRVSGYRTPPI